MRVICRLAVMVTVLVAGVSSFNGGTRFGVRNSPAVALRIGRFQQTNVLMSATLEQDNHHGRGHAFVTSVRKHAPVLFRRTVRVLGPFLLQLAIAVLFVNVAPAFAARKGKSTELAAAVSAEVATEVAAVATKPPLWKLLLEGATAQGKFKKLKAGDSRSEFAAILNSLSSGLVLAALAFVAFLKHKQRESRESAAASREIRKIDEYKENMYFEAVQDILRKINDSKTKGSTKANLQKQLKDLDPEGVIQRFLEQGGERPDISHIINKKPKKKSKPGAKPLVLDRPKSKKGTPPAAPTKSKTGRSTPTYEDEDDENEKEEDEDNDEDEEEEVKKVQPPAKKSPPAQAASRAAPSPAPVSSPKGDSEMYTQVLSELYDSLDGKVSNKLRNKVVEYLKSRIESIGDAKKREVTVSKIAERLGDDDYWVEYANKMDSQ